MSLTVFFALAPQRDARVVDSKIDQSIAIVVETEQNPDGANFPLKSKAKDIDGLDVGFPASEENFCAYKSVRYDSSE